MGRPADCSAGLRDVQLGCWGAPESHVLLEWAAFPMTLSHHREAAQRKDSGSQGTAAGPPVSYAPSSRRTEWYIFIAATSGIKMILTVSQIQS